MIAVVDASALAAIVFNEPLAEEIRDRLANRQLVAPRLLACELLNTAAKKIRRYPDQAAAIRTGVERALADDLAIRWSDVEPVPVLELAVATGLTAYDATYLWLAKHLGAELVTLDRAFIAPEQAMGGGPVDTRADIYYRMRGVLAPDRPAGVRRPKKDER